MSEAADAAASGGSDVSWFLPAHGDGRYPAAVRPRSASPILHAGTTAALYPISEDRLFIDLVTGGPPVGNAGAGIFRDHDARHEVTRAFLDICRPFGETAANDRRPAEQAAQS
ncbi:LLM class flavin-dependent oxidoreductase [Ancylobacter sp. Lp-2]|uniref:LLM class flavin-dependent oxidoreductase n=1 Tax=Ancylobacter sp. Lp-2 TaxID=2881339 RepID=UPI001E2F0E43|nr:LLM class flavin-dependent oxidoreductase [Ancylobacter sp. Lp-2]MCB4769690.1 LLM class flavin-dependent oxidoreductase [Ancylobacter sp. Lp-2]